MRKKILFFSQNHVRGGAVRVFTDLVRNWPGEEDDITVGVNEANECLQYYYEAVKSDRVKMWPIPVKSNRDKYNVIMRYSFPRYIRYGLLVIFITVLNPIWFVRDILCFRRQLKRQGFDAVISSNGGYPGGELCLRVVIGAKLAGVKKIILVIHNYPVPRNMLGRWFWSIFDRTVSYCCSSIISVCKDCADVLNEKCSFTRDVGFIYNGLEIGKDTNGLKQKREALGINADEKVIGAIGNLERRKGFDYLILAMAEVVRKFPESRLIIIGGDTYGFRGELENLIEKHSLDGRVTLTGFMAGAAQYMECFDIAAIPSFEFETLAAVYLEAMYYKRPIIGTSVGAAPEVIQDGETGFIVSPRDEKALAEKIIYLLSHPERASQMGENSGERLKLFTVERMAKQYFDLTV